MWLMENALRAAQKDLRDEARDKTILRLSLKTGSLPPAPCSMRFAK
jgi:hypothetical protein